MEERRSGRKRRRTTATLPLPSAGPPRRQEPETHETKGSTGMRLLNYLVQNPLVPLDEIGSSLRDALAEDPAERDETLDALARVRDAATLSLLHLPSPARISQPEGHPYLARAYARRLAATVAGECAGPGPASRLASLGLLGDADGMPKDALCAAIGEAISPGRPQDVFDWRTVQTLPAVRRAWTAAAEAALASAADERGRCRRIWDALDVGGTLGTGTQATVRRGRLRGDPGAFPVAVRLAEFGRGERGSAWPTDADRSSVLARVRALLESGASPNVSAVYARCALHGPGFRRTRIEASELAEGTATDLIRALGSDSPAIATAVVQALMGGLALAAVGVAHEDLRTDNLLWSRIAPSAFVYTLCGRSYAVDTKGALIKIADLDGAVPRRDESAERGSAEQYWWRGCLIDLSFMLSTAVGAGAHGGWSDRPWFAWARAAERALRARTLVRSFHEACEAVVAALELPEARDGRLGWVPWPSDAASVEPVASFDLDSIISYP